MFQAWSSSIVRDRKRTVKSENRAAVASPSTYRTKGQPTLDIGGLFSTLRGRREGRSGRSPAPSVNDVRELCPLRSGWSLGGVQRSAPAQPKRGGNSSDRQTSGCGLRNRRWGFPYQVPDNQSGGVRR